MRQDWTISKNSIEAYHDPTFFPHQSLILSRKIIAFADAKLPSDTVAYCYRHGFTHRALVNGVPMHMVAELLGHTSTRMVEQVYGHLDKAKDLLKEAASIVARKPTAKDRS